MNSEELESPGLTSSCFCILFRHRVSVELRLVWVSSLPRCDPSESCLMEDQSSPCFLVYCAYTRLCVGSWADHALWPDGQNVVANPAQPIVVSSQGKRGRRNLLLSLSATKPGRWRMWMLTSYQHDQHHDNDYCNGCASAEIEGAV